MLRMRGAEAGQLLRSYESPVKGYCDEQIRAAVRFNFISPKVKKRFFGTVPGSQ